MDELWPELTWRWRGPLNKRDSACVFGAGVRMACTGRPTVSLRGTELPDRSRGQVGTTWEIPEIKEEQGERALACLVSGSF